MISSSSNFAAKRTFSRAFTTVELLIAASLGTMILAGVLTTFITITKSSMRVANYAEMESQTRRAFEQLGIDARMANAFSATFNSGTITSFTLTIPNSDLTQVYQVTYGYDTSDGTNKKLFVVPGSDPTITTGRKNLVTNVDELLFLRYNSTGALIPTSTTSSAAIKHIQVAVAVKRATTGVANATQVIRSSAFTLRNISL